MYFKNTFLHFRNTILLFKNLILYLKKNLWILRRITSNCVESHQIASFGAKSCQIVLNCVKMQCSCHLDLQGVLGVNSQCFSRWKHIYVPVPVQLQVEQAKVSYFRFQVGSSMLSHFSKGFYRLFGVGVVSGLWTFQAGHFKLDHFRLVPFQFRLTPLMVFMCYLKMGPF